MKILERVSPCDYKIQLPKRVITFHANMLKKYDNREVLFPDKTLVIPESTVEVESCATISVVDECILLENEQDAREIPSYNVVQTESYKDVNFSEDSTSEQKENVENLVKEFEDIFSDIPGRTNLLEEDIKLERDEPIKAQHYNVPHAPQDELCKENLLETFPSTNCL